MERKRKRVHCTCNLPLMLFSVCVKRKETQLILQRGETGDPGARCDPQLPTDCVYSNTPREREKEEPDFCIIVKVRCTPSSLFPLSPSHMLPFPLLYTRTHSQSPSLSGPMSAQSASTAPCVNIDKVHRPLTRGGRKRPYAPCVQVIPVDIDIEG